MVRVGTQIEIADVPHLSRVSLKGKVIRQAKVQIAAHDLNLNGAPCVELSFQPIVGISGGPVVADGKVIAMNSFADPGSFRETWAQILNPTSAVQGLASR